MCELNSLPHKLHRFTQPGWIIFGIERIEIQKLNSKEKVIFHSLEAVGLLSIDSKVTHIAMDALGDCALASSNYQMSNTIIILALLF